MLGIQIAILIVLEHMEEFLKRCVHLFSYFALEYRSSKCSRHKRKTIYNWPSILSSKSTIYSNCQRDLSYNCSTSAKSSFNFQIFKWCYDNRYLRKLSCYFSDIYENAGRHVYFCGDQLGEQRLVHRGTRLLIY